MRSSLMAIIPPDSMVPPVKLLVPLSTNFAGPVLMSLPLPVFKLEAQVEVALA